MCYLIDWDTKWRVISGLEKTLIAQKVGGSNPLTHASDEKNLEKSGFFLFF